LHNLNELQIEMEGTQSDPVFRFEGQLLGENPLPVQPSAGLNSVTIDLAGLSRINSMGVRQWDRWMISIRKANSKALIRLVHIPSFFIDLFFVIHEFVPRPFAVESFCVPYFCEQCDRSLDFLVERDAKGRLPEKLEYLPTIDCAKCNTPMQLDIPSERALAFIDRAENSV
jgi:hypothetical protein